MSKMTDEQIIKALECCIKPTSDCDNCPLYIRGDGDCIDKAKQGALDIINRQQAEIERLQKDLNYAKNIITWDGETPLCKWEEEIKSEAIKEFADKLKADINKTWYYELENDTHNARALKRVDELVKEMVGEGK